MYIAEIPVATAKVFISGNSQAVRLPKEFRFKGDAVEIYRRGDEVVMRERAVGMESAAQALLELPADMFDNIKDARPPQRRKGL
jgi:antitoxin VapB